MSEVTPEPPQQQPTDAPQGNPDEDVPPGLGEAGKQALDRMKAERNEAKQAARLLEQQMTEFQNAQRVQTEALAKVFGLKEGEKPEADNIAERVNAIQERLDKAERESRRLSIAAEHEIPKNYHHLLTATDDETLAAQALAVAELVKGKSPTGPAPDPSQGAQPTSPQARADAEYEQFYPSTRK